jgi:hypothetical protein
MSSRRLPPAVSRGQPTVTNNRNQHITGTDHFFYGFNEVNAGIKSVHVHEDLIRRKVVLQTVG